MSKRAMSWQLCIGRCGELTLHHSQVCVHCLTPLTTIVVHQPTDYDAHTKAGGAVPCGTGLASLSHRERKILWLLGSGTGVGNVAKMLNTTDAAIRSHRARICSKLGITFRAGLDVLRNYVETHDLEYPKAKALREARL